jgi:hypothetical protein
MFRPRDAARFGFLLLSLAVAARAQGPPARIAERPPDPHGSPRPARDATDVPLRTSLYVELAAPKGAAGPVDPASVTLALQPDGREASPLLSAGGTFAEGARGWIKPKSELSGAKALAVYVEPGRALDPATRYTVRVGAGGGEAGSWSFTTEPDPATHARPVAFALDLGAAPVRWHGRFFSGICNVIFCSQRENYGPTYALMGEAHRAHPGAWDYQRDFWPTGTEFRPAGFLPQRLPNLVRERETRRIAAMEVDKEQIRLKVEDVFGHDQYGVEAGRPLDGDYRPGDEVLIADGVHDARAKVVAVDDGARTVTVTTFAAPEGGWKVAYEGPPPTREDPDAPGLFPPGGCYLRKFNPVGTPVYYWGRLDKEWDLAHRTYGRRLMVNFADAPGDLARDGRSWTTVKDYAQWHDVARTIAGHVIDRYGAAAQGFTWSVFNEPDLGALFWRADWDELQTFYDYTTDAVLRAFEERGYDSKKVFIGGLELGGIFGTNLRLREFLAHCSPRAAAKGALPRNAAFADARLDGKRSRRVEDLCRANGGKGSPCDFVSIHSYNASALMAAKLARAKEIALEIDPEYYRELWVNSHESCPDWMPPPDEAAAASYLGNGFFPSWCLDVVHRQLERAAADARFAFGETILTVWPPPSGLQGINAVTRNLACDDDGDGRADRDVTVPMPIFHALGLLSDLGDRYWVLPAREDGGRRVGGFASRGADGTLRVLVYSHAARDAQSRSEATSDVTVDVGGLPGAGPARVAESRFDADHNSPFRLIERLDREREGRAAPDAARVADLTRGLEGDDPEAQRRALDALAGLGREARRAALGAVFALAGRAKDPAVRDAATALLRGAMGPEVYPRATVDAIVAATTYRVTATATTPREPDGHLRLTTRLAANGVNVLVIEPDERAK